MYHFVEDKQMLEAAQKCACMIVERIQNEVREDGIVCQFFLIGSGARNMVTQNENEPFDFDYNLNILSQSASKFSERQIKIAVIKAANRVMREIDNNDVKDSTSSLAIGPLCLAEQRGVVFSIDLGIVTKDSEGNWHRLIHQKRGQAGYYWNKIRNSRQIRGKADWIKSKDGWEKVRTRYLDLKNHYLIHGDHTHPSYVCYIQAVNEIYQKLKH